MWEGGIDHGSHDALLLQAAGGAMGGGDAHGHASALLPPPYMVPHHQLPAPFGGEQSAAGPFGFGFGAGGYCEDGGAGLGHHQYGLFGFGQETPPQQQQHGVAAGGEAASSSLQQMEQQGPRVVSGLLGTLQAELGRMTAKEAMDAKALAASRSHSEAERRRRQRINSHLARLRSLLPNTTKTDKASLLAEVIEHVKELKRQTAEMMAGEAPVEQMMLPTEADELAVEAAEDEEGRLVARASLCCEDRPDLIPDIVRALAALRLRAHRAEIATLGGRVRNVLLITAVDEEGHEGGEEDDDDDDVCAIAAASHRRRHELATSIQEALRAVMDRKAASSGDTTSSSGGGSGSIKRQRVNCAHEQAGSL